MIRTCGNLIIFSLKLIFKSMINNGAFLEDWSKSNAALIHKRESKKLSYLLVSLLPTFSKFFKRLVFNTLFNFFFNNKLFIPCQTDFIPAASCVLQLLSVPHEIYESFDFHPPTDMRGAFLDISKAFDKV